MARACVHGARLRHQQRARPDPVREGVLVAVAGRWLRRVEAQALVAHEGDAKRRVLPHARHVLHKVEPQRRRVVDARHRVRLQLGDRNVAEDHRSRRRRARRALVAQDGATQQRDERNEELACERVTHEQDVERRVSARPPRVRPVAALAKDEPAAERRRVEGLQFASGRLPPLLHGLARRIVGQALVAGAPESSARIRPTLDEWVALHVAV